MEQSLKTPQFYTFKFIKQWRWWYKLLFALLGVAGLTIALYNGLTEVYNNLNEVNSVKYDEYFDIFFSYFTNQTNILVLCWYLYALIRPDKEGQSKFLGFTGSVLTATYISITSLIWTGMIFPGEIASHTVNPWYTWFGTFSLHIIVPISIVLYIVVFNNKYQNVKTTKQWFKRSWIAILYPLIYGIINLIRGEIKLLSNKTGSRAYPYFFLQMHSDGSDLAFGIPGVGWFFIAVSIIFAIAIGFSTLYVYGINKMKLKTN